MAKIIDLSDTKDPNDEHCSICKFDEPNSMVTIKGGAPCGYCGNQINLCEKHFDQLVVEVGMILANQELENFYNRHKLNREAKKHSGRKEGEEVDK